MCNDIMTNELFLIMTQAKRQISKQYNFFASKLRQNKKVYFKPRC